MAADAERIWCANARSREGEDEGEEEDLLDARAEEEWAPKGFTPTQET